MKPLPSRLHALDVYRGLTMFFLMGEAARVYHALDGSFAEGSMGALLVQQFHHHPWNGLRFWDLIQPFFMFIVGVAMPFSLKKRLERGDTWGQAFRHILQRCALLFLFGVGLHCIYSHRLVWELWNVLTQLSFTILVTFLLMRLPLRTMFAVSLGLLLLTEMLYRGYDPSSPFVKDENFGSWMDLLLMGKLNDGGGWVTINCLPTAAHTIWGAICGKILLSDRLEGAKIRTFLYAGFAGLIIGYGLDWAGITPIVKRIATTSFTFASGGWAILALAFFYWWVDIKGKKNWTWFFTIVGMNSIFIYLFSETIGHQWLNGAVKIFNHGFLSMAGLPDNFMDVTAALISLAILWYLCYFLFKNRIFIKI